MKNVILYNYNLEAQELLKQEDGSYSFYVDYEKFYMMKVRRPKENIEDIKKIIEVAPKDFHKIVVNRFSSIYTPFENSEYVLLKLIGPEHTELNLSDIISNQKAFEIKNFTLNRTNWSKMWEEKVDYLEYQVSELATPHKIIKGSFSYYIGLAENAIEYFNLLSPTNLNTYVARRRITYPLYSFDYYNPLELVVDYRVRDIAGYLKIAFFDDGDVLKEVDMLLNKDILSPLEYNLLYARLLYPSYYFDAMQGVLERNESEDNLLKYIDKVDSYEKFLNDIYEKFTKKCSMLKIDWLIKKS